MKFYNNNSAYGDCGPFEAENREKLADEMQDTFESWALDEWNEFSAHAEDEGVETMPKTQFISEKIAEMRGEFISSLDEVA